MPVRARTQIALCAMTLPTLLVAAACEKPPAPPRNDNFAGATILAASPQGRSSGTTVGSTRQTGEPRSETSSTVWFRWRAPINGAVTFTGTGGLPVAIDAFTGASVNHLRQVAADESLQKTGFRVAAGTNYAIRVASYAGSPIGLTWAAVTPPANDMQTAPADLSGGTGSVVSDSMAASSAIADPKIDTFRAPATLWYRWTAPATGSYDFDTHGSRISSVLGIYSDASPMQTIVDSSGGCGDFLSVATASVRFAATAGSSYLLMVGGNDAYNDSANPSGANLGGPIQLNWRQVTNAPVASGNDAFVTPTHLTGTNGSVTGDTGGATAEAGEPAQNGVAARSSVWFSWTPPVSGDYVLSALPDANDACAAGLAVYTGSSLGTLRNVRSSNNDFLMSAATSTSFSGGISGAIDSGAYGTRVHLFAGTPYRIAADGRGFPGSFTLRWDIPQAAPTIRFAAAGNGSVGVIWSPPKATAGSPRSGYFVTVLSQGDEFDSSEPQLLPVTAAFTTVRGLHNGTTYRVMVAAINGSGLGDFAVSRPVTPKK